jgi:hypothetical protein
LIDECGECGGDGSSCGACQILVNNDACNPPTCNLFNDECGICGGDNSSCADECGVPNGDNSICQGCDGVFGSDLENDECGECGGDNSFCTGCTAQQWDNNTVGACNSGIRSDGGGNCNTCNDAGACSDGPCIISGGNCVYPTQWWEDNDNEGFGCAGYTQFPPEIIQGPSEHAPASLQVLQFPPPSDLIPELQAPTVLLSHCWAVQPVQNELSPPHSPHSSFSKSEPKTPSHP